MVRRRQRERSLFEVLLPDGHKLWPDWLRRIDTALEDEAVIEVVAQATAFRSPCPMSVPPAEAQACTLYADLPHYHFTYASRT